MLVVCHQLSRIGFSMFSLKKTTSYALLFVIGLMAQNIDAAKYMLGIRQAGEPVWGDKNSRHEKVDAGSFCISVLMEECTEIPGHFKFIEAKTSDNVLFLDVTAHPKWQVCIPNSNYLVSFDTRGIDPIDLTRDPIEQLRELLGPDTEFAYEPTFCGLYQDLYPHAGLLCCDVLAELCAEVGVKKSPGHRRSHSSADLDEENNGRFGPFQYGVTVPVVATYDGPKGARRLAFFGSLPGFEEEAVHAPRKEDSDDEGEDSAPKSSMSAVERQALLASLLRTVGIEGGIAEEGDEADEADDDTSKQMGKVD